MTAVELWNLALLKIGITQSISALDEASREAYTGQLVYDHLLRTALRRFPWAFATKYATLTLIQGPAWANAPVQAWTVGQSYTVNVVVVDAAVTYYAVVGHVAALANEPPNAAYWTTTPPRNVNGDWSYAYREPIDCIFERRLVPPGDYGRRFRDYPPPFRKGRDTNGFLIYTHQQDAVLEYTTIDCLHLWTDDLFIEHFTWLLAGAAAPGLSRVANMATTCLQMAEATIQIAQAVDAREAQQEKPGEAEWIRARGGVAGPYGDWDYPGRAD